MPFPLGSVTLLGATPPVISWTIPNLTTNYDETAWRADAAAAGWDGVSAAELIATLGAGSVMGATATSQAAFDTGSTLLPLDATLKLIVEGRVLGKGGPGGDGGDGYPYPTGRTNGEDGSFGGPAITARIPLLIDNSSGIIGGGGGAGGGGQSASKGGSPEGNDVDQYGGGGGGAGQGYTSSPGGLRGTSNPGQLQAEHGGASSENDPGAGGRGAGDGGDRGGDGGDGGGLGIDGQSGSGATTSFDFGVAGAGGAAGPAVEGVENVTWVAQGDTRGPLVSL